MSSTTGMIMRRKARKERRAAQRARTRLVTGLIAGVIALLIGVPLIVFAGGALLTYSAAVADFPRPADTTFVGSLRGATRLTDLSGGTVIYAVEDPLGASRRWITLDELPDYVIAATLLVEDQGFYERPRFDPLTTALRLWENLLNGPLRADASLTGRLVRNAIAPPPEFVTVEDRGREIALIAETERRYTPDEILEWHLNTNYYGNEAYGIEAAARVYLGKAAADLTLDEAALLASIPTAPQFNPIDDETAARGRQADTLRRLLVANVITSGEYDEASRALTMINTSLAASPAVADDFSIYARRQAESILNRLGMDGGRMVSRGGLTITTSLDLDLYYQAECALRAHLNRLNGRSEPVAALNGSACVAANELPPLAAADFGAAPPDSGTVVILDPVTGVVRVMVGAATRVENQPGMTLAPFAYFEGFRESRQGTQYTPASMLLDIPQRFPGAAEGLIYQPANPDGVFRGPLSLREAAAEGLIPPVTQVADNHSLSNILRTAHRLGVNSLDDALYDLSLFDRGGVVSALDVAYAYSVFATMGDMYGVEARPRGTAFRNRDPVAVLRIEDGDGRVLWAYDPQASRVNVFSSFSELGYLINSIYSDRDARRQKFGSDNPLLVSRTAAVVNSTAGNKLDNWTVGYTPQAVVAVHLDRADTNPFTLNGYGLDGAAHVWHALTEYVHRDLPPADWSRPANIVERQVCQISGLLPNSACPVRREIFINGIVPAANDSFWQSIEINGQTGQLATFNTPNALRVNETYFIPPDEALDWWRANNQKLPPTTYDVLSRPDNALFNTAVLTQPEALAWIRGTVEVRGVISDPAFAAYQLRFGEGAINPQNWFNIGERQTVNPEDGLLGVWDTSGLDGVYTIELTVESTNGARQRAVTQVRVDNIPPSVILTAGEQGKVYRWPSETVIPLAADVRDNLAVERVEFYNNGRLVFTDTDAPYAYDFAIAGIGIQSFSVVAYDAAGNQNNSAEVFVEVTR